MEHAVSFSFFGIDKTTKKNEESNETVPTLIVAGYPCIMWKG